MIVGGEVGEAGELRLELHLYGAGRAMALLADDDLSRAVRRVHLGLPLEVLLGTGARLLHGEVILLTIDEHHHIGVLLDRARLAEVRELRSKLGQSPDLEKQAASLEGSSRRPRGDEDEDEDAGGLTKLNNDLNSVLGVIEGADATPTTQAVATVGELARRLQSLLTRVSELKAKLK